MGETRQAVEDIELAVNGHYAMVRAREREWSHHGNAVRGKFWAAGNLWTQPLHETAFELEDDELPIRLEVNRLRPWLVTQTAQLSYRAVKAKVTPPSVIPARKGRPPDLALAQSLVSSLSDDLMARADFSAEIARGLRLGLLQDAAAFKVFVAPGNGDVLSRLQMQVIPRRYVMWDETVSLLDQQSYRGHLRDVTEDEALDITGEKLPDSIVPRTLPHRPGAEVWDWEDPKGISVTKYVRILEWYDMGARELRFFYVQEGGYGSVKVFEAGGIDKIPWTLPNGQPGVPIEPIILDPDEERPLQGTPPARSLYALTAEDNLLMSIAGTHIRRDSARITAVLSDRLPPEFIAALASGRDGVIEGVKADTLEGLWKTFELPDLSPHLARWQDMLAYARREAQGTSDQQQGKSGQYISATEAQLISAYGEVTNWETQRHMANAMSRTLRLAHTVLAAELVGSREQLAIRVGAKYHVLDPEYLTLPWTLDIMDRAASPVNDDKDKAGFLQVHSVLMASVEIASSPVDQTGPDGQPVPPLPAAVRLYHQRVIDFIIEKWGLPENLGWDQLQLSAEKLAAAEAPTPSLLDDAEAKDLVDRALASIGAGAGPALPPDAGVAPVPGLDQIPPEMAAALAPPPAIVGH